MSACLIVCVIQLSSELMSRDEMTRDKCLCTRTVSTAPGKLFPKLSSIHVIHVGAVVGLLLPYAFPPKKTVYKNRRQQTQAAITAFQEISTETSSTSCFFHLEQCVWRKIQQVGLAAAYEERDRKFAVIVRSLSAL